MGAGVRLTGPKGVAGVCGSLGVSGLWSAGGWGVGGGSPWGAEWASWTPTAVGFDAEPDEFSDFDRLRSALPTSGSSTGEPPSGLCGTLSLRL